MPDAPITTPIDPTEHDTRTAELHEQAAKAQAALDSQWDRLHRLAGDRKSYVGRQNLWKMTGAQVLQQVESLVSVHGDQYDPRHGCKPSDALAKKHELLTRLAEVMTAIEAAEAVYRQYLWNRFFPCQNTDGHIHSSFRNCPSVRWDTAMAWYPQLSGKTAEDAVNELGPALCSICFPLAPVEHKSMTLGQVEKERTRSEREAAKAAREEAKAAKNLTPGQQFRDHRGDRVETVAACKQILRSERELYHYYGQGPHCWHAEAAGAAITAKNVLLDREAAKPGTGATQAEIDKIIAKADKKHRQEAGL